MEFTEPNPGALTSFTGRTELRVIEEVEELGAEIQTHLSAGSAICLMTEKSVLTKSGPMAGTRDALPNSPRGAQQSRLR